MSAPPRLVLASGSPRRADLLRQLGLAFEVHPVEVDESVRPGEGPEEHVERLAREKAEAVPHDGDVLVIGGDTVVVLEGRVLGKPSGPVEATEMLRALSGKTHRVLTGVAVAGADGTRSGFGAAEVRFRDLQAEEIQAYVDSGEPLDKAGAYGIQSLGAALVAEIRGDYYSVVGFPVIPFLDLLRRSGWRYAFGGLEPSG